MAYRVEFEAPAIRSLRALSKQLQRRITEKIEALSDEARPPGVKKLTSTANLYRIRIGDYRVIYQINDGEQSIMILKIGHRGDVYS